MKIFVSYTVRNGRINRKILYQVYSKLENIGYVFIDLLHNKAGGQQRVVQELERCDLILLIEKRSPLISEWVRFEIGYAKEFNKPVVTFSLNDLISESTESIYQRLTNRFGNKFCTSANSAFPTC